MQHASYVVWSPSHIHVSSFASMFNFTTCKFSINFLHWHVFIIIWSSIRRTYNVYRSNLASISVHKIFLTEPAVHAHKQCPLYKWFNTIFYNILFSTCIRHSPVSFTYGFRWIVFIERCSCNNINRRVWSQSVSATAHADLVVLAGRPRSCPVPARCHSLQIPYMAVVCVHLAIPSYRPWARISLPVTICGDWGTVSRIISLTMPRVYQHSNVKSHSYLHCISRISVH